MMGRVVAGCRFDHIGVTGMVLAERANRLDQLTRIAQRLMVLQLLKQLCQPVMAVLQQLRQYVAVAVATVDQSFVKGFQLMGQVTDRLDLSHSCATLEGVQITLQRRQRRSVLRLAQPTLQGLTRAVENIHRFLEEDRNDLVVQLTVPCRSEQARSYRGQGVFKFGGDIR
ncbi:hypothetical protein D3C76_977040 [compost metagenome]